MVLGSGGGGRRSGPRVRRLLPVADPVAGEVVLAVDAGLVGAEDGDGWVGVLLDPLEGGAELRQEGGRAYLYTQIFIFNRNKVIVS